MLRSGRVMRSILFTVVTTVLAFVIFSCVPVTSGTNPKEVTIQTSRHGHITNAYVVYAKDGLSGTWIKLTGTNGVYKFTVNDSNGLYSVAVGEPATEYTIKYAYFFNAKLSETNFVPIDVGYPTQSDAATVTITVPSAYANKYISVFFHHEHRFPFPSESDSKTYVADYLPKGKADLVIFIGTPWAETGIEKIAMIRDFELNEDKVVVITEAQLKDPESATVFKDISVEWLVGGSSYVFATPDVKIPSSLKADKDLYLMNYSDWTNGFEYTEYRKNYPTTTPFATSSINPADLPTTPVSTSTTADNLKISLASYSSGLFELSTILYAVEFYSYSEINDWGLPVKDSSYIVYMSSGYLASLTNNEYIVPKMGGDFAGFDVDVAKNIKVEKPMYVASNKSLKDLFIPVDGMKVLKH